MAGLGKRFSDNNYNLPKPLILIKNKPMFIQAAKSMPKSKTNIFVCNKKMADQFKIEEILTKEFKNRFILIKIKRKTKGQANTCLLAKKYLKNNDKIFIHSCDSLIEFETNNLKKDLDEYEGIIYTTKANKIHVKNIKSYGWVNLRKNKIFKISCKQKASSYPKKDLVIIGSFAFKNKKIFLKLIRKLIQSKQKINNEYYLDMVFKVAFENRHKIKNVKVKTYYSWGTPEELTNWIKKFEKKLLK